MLNERSLVDVLPIIVGSLKEECYELEECEKQLALEIAVKSYDTKLSIQSIYKSKSFVKMSSIFNHNKTIKYKFILFI